MRGGAFCASCSVEVLTVGVPQAERLLSVEKRPALYLDLFVRTVKECFSLCRWKSWAAEWCLVLPIMQDSAEISVYAVGEFSSVFNRFNRRPCLWIGMCRPVREGWLASRKSFSCTSTSVDLCLNPVGFAVGPESHGGCRSGPCRQYIQPAARPGCGDRPAAHRNTGSSAERSAAERDPGCGVGHGHVSAEHRADGRGVALESVREVEQRRETGRIFCRRCRTCGRNSQLMGVSAAASWIQPRRWQRLVAPDRWRHSFVLEEQSLPDQDLHRRG